jgi:catechol 2,3-dioxygenase-like lactoylglutathione lyase family enzyme
MKFQSHYAVLITDQVSITSAFYQEHLGFRPAFENDWYVSLVTESAPSHELAIVQAGHPSIPGLLQEPTRSLILNFEVEDVGPVYQRLIHQARLPLLLDLRDEPWGQRHFITQDPNGILLDMIQIIPPSEEFLKQYANPEKR